MSKKVVKTLSQQNTPATPAHAGTPKTLTEAIENGLAAGDIEAHVRDFINNKVCVLSISANEAESKAAFKLHELLLREKAA